MLVREFDAARAALDGGDAEGYTSTRPRWTSSSDGAGAAGQGVPPRAGTPDHRFPPEQSGFEITIELEGEDEVMLNIAAEVDNRRAGSRWRSLDPAAAGAGDRADGRAQAVPGERRRVRQVTGGPRP